MQWTQDKDIDLNIGHNLHSRKLPKKKTHLQDTRKKVIVKKICLKTTAQEKISVYIINKEF